MSRITQAAPNQTEAEAEFVWPEFNPSIGYREFIERLRLARIERGLSIADMSDEVGLTFRLAHEFEAIQAPLPFEWLEVWCETVGVQFEDFLTIYWADEEAYAAAKEREADQKEAAQNAPSSTNTKADTTETETLAPSNASLTRRFGVLSALRAALERIARFCHSLFSTP